MSCLGVTEVTALWSYPETFYKFVFWHFFGSRILGWSYGCHWSMGHSHCYLELNVVQYTKTWSFLLPYNVSKWFPFRTAWQWLLGPGIRFWRFGTKVEKEERIQGTFSKNVTKKNGHQTIKSLNEVFRSEVLKTLSPRNVRCWSCDRVGGPKKEMDVWCAPSVALPFFIRGEYWSSWWFSFMMQWSFSHS